MPTSSGRTAPIRTRGLTKRFGKLLAVDRLNLSLKRGEVFGLLGPNGAGKTTTLRMLLGFLRPSDGDLRVLGGDPADTRIRARVGYVPAEPHLNPRHTVSEWLKFCAEIRGDRRQTDELIERLDLDPARRIGELSTGNKQKVGIAAAFATEPDLLVLDEPTSGLDPFLQRTFRELVRESVKEGSTVLLSSHMLHEVELTADRIGLIREGRLAMVAGIADLRRRARRRLDFRFEKHPSLASLRKVPGVVSVEELDRIVRVTLQGSAAPLMRAAARLGVHGLHTHEADLDEIFFGAYGSEAAK